MILLDGNVSFIYNRFSLSSLITRIFLPFLILNILKKYINNIFMLIFSEFHEKYYYTILSSKLIFTIRVTIKFIMFFFVVLIKSLGGDRIVMYNKYKCNQIEILFFKIFQFNLFIIFEFIYLKNKHCSSHNELSVLNTGHYTRAYI
jgi:hypothetical protein